MAGNTSEQNDSGEELERKVNIPLLFVSILRRKRSVGVIKVICNYCGKMLGEDPKNGTRHLHDHFKRCPLRATRDINNQF